MKSVITASDCPCAALHTGLDGRDEPVEIRPTAGELVKKGEL